MLGRAACPSSCSCGVMPPGLARIKQAALDGGRLRAGQGAGRGWGLLQVALLGTCGAPDHFGQPSPPSSAGRLPAWGA